MLKISAVKRSVQNIPTFYIRSYETEIEERNSPMRSAFMLSLTLSIQYTVSKHSGEAIEEIHSPTIRKISVLSSLGGKL